MNEAHHLTSPMVVRSLDVKNDPFRPCEKGEELHGLEVPCKTREIPISGKMAKS